MIETPQPAGPDPGWRLSAVGAITAVAPAEWDACAGTDNPFLCHDFLSALEESGSVGGDSGWYPRHLLLTDGQNRLIGGVPAYLKTHSYGEYVFDHGWADAYERAGGRYYPKLQAAVPFTPVPGPRLLLRPGAPIAAADALIDGLIGLADQTEASSIHVTFPNQGDFDRLVARGFLARLGMQFHWQNRGYRRFEDFLADLTARKRKSIRKEREAVLASGLVIETLSGEAIRPAHWDAFHRLYQATVDRKWGGAYLTRAFFTALGRRLGDRVVLVVASDRGRIVAGALNLRGTDTLYGRNWGVAGDYPFLHFELCYYRAIDYAISQGLTRVEAGAQGRHKIQRGYRPVATYSAHYLRDPRLAAAVAAFLARERPVIEAEITALDEFTPFHRAPMPGDDPLA